MQRPTVRVNVTVKPELTVRRPPRALIELLDQPEDEFREYVAAVEHSREFQDLIDAGAVRRVRARGRLPREKYEEYMDVQLMQFLRQHQITRHSDWERVFADPASLEKLPVLAARFDVDAEQLGKMIGYYQQVTFEEEAAARYGHADLDAPEPDYVELIPSRADLDLTDQIVLMRDFVEVYGIDQEEFSREFMSGDRSAEALAAAYNAPIDEVREILDALGRVQIAETFVAGAERRDRPARAAGQPVEHIEPVARVLLTDQARAVSIQFTDDGMYAQRYRTSPAALQKIETLRGDQGHLERLLLELQWINQRKNLLCRLVLAACNHQYPYFLTGDVHALKPLSQAEIARQLGEDEATICRLLRDKYLDTPTGPMELKYLFQKKTDVVRRIVERHPELTDNEIREILERDFETNISRRTVAYHRLKAQRAQNAKPH